MAKDDLMCSKRAFVFSIIICTCVCLLMLMTCKAFAANDTVADAQHLEFDEEVKAYPTNSGIWFYFNIPTSGSLRISSISDLYEVDYDIYHESGVHKSDWVWYGSGYRNSSTGENRMDKTAFLSKGRYYLKVRTSYSSSGSSSTFRAMFTPTNETIVEEFGASNDTLSNASNIEFNKEYLEQLGCGDSKDWYKFTLPYASEITLLSDADLKSVNYEFYYMKDEYSNANKEKWFSGYMSSVTGQNKLNKTFTLNGGTYYLLVSGDTGENSNGVKGGCYRFSLMCDSIGIGPFSDVKASDYYAEPVLWAYNNNITTGTSSTTFSPEQACDRAQMVTFLWRAQGSPNPKSTTINPFRDVSSSDYYYKAVIWAVEKGITTGTSTTTFSPHDQVNRAQAATFLYRLSGTKYDPMSPFGDVQSDDYFASAVNWAAKNGITTGTSATTFSPYDPCQRAQVVTFLYRYKNNI